MFPAILTSDLHLTDAPCDEYRWSIFDRIAEHAKREKARSIIILGDLTDAKDRHSARLVRRVTYSIAQLADERDVHILKGNHDYVNEDYAFFSFLTLIDHVRFIETPYDFGTPRCVFIPHSRDPEVLKQGLRLVDDKTVYCFMHHTVGGAKASNGQVMQGDEIKFPRPSSVKYFSGDIHVPQRVGPLEYVGSPYPVHFGDTFGARIMVLNKDTTNRSIHWTGLQRRVVDVHQEYDIDRLGDFLRQDDQVKIRMHLSRSDLDGWTELKQAAQKKCDLLGVRIASIELAPAATRRQLISVDRPDLAHSSPQEVLRRYAKQQGVDPLALEQGESLL